MASSGGAQWPVGNADLMYMSSSDSSDLSDSDQAAQSATTLDLRRRDLDACAVDYSIQEMVKREPRRVAIIDTVLLRENRLYRFPSQLRTFARELRVLDISANALTELPDIFGHCSGLRTLTARNNRLGDASMAKQYTAPGALRELNLSGNELTRLPEQLLEFTNLKYLYVGGNRIHTLTPKISKLKNLHILSLGGNHLTEVPSSVGDLKLLHGLVLCDNQIELIPASIANLKNLKSLLLHKNQIKTLPPEIVTLRNLSELSLRENPLVVRFVSDMSLNPPSLLELAGRTAKIHNLEVKSGDVPINLFNYLNSAHRCVNEACKGVFFDNRVEHIKFVDFCGKYRLPLLQYLCSSKCRNDGERSERNLPGGNYMMRKVLLG